MVKNFLNFIREQGVIGLATGFLLGGAVSKVVTSLIQDIINPLLGIVLGIAGGFSNASIKLDGTEIFYGKFITVVVDFLVVAAVVYIGVKILGLDKLDKKKQ